MGKGSAGVGMWSRLCLVHMSMPEVLLSIRQDRHGRFELVWVGVWGRVGVDGAARNAGVARSWRRHQRRACLSINNL